MGGTCNTYFFFPYDEMCKGSDLLTISLKIIYLMTVKSLISHGIIHAVRTKNFSETLTFLTPWYAHVSRRARGQEILVFAYSLNDPHRFMLTLIRL